MILRHRANIKVWFVDWVKVVVRHLAFQPFEPENTKLLSVISRLPYSKSTKALSLTLVGLK
jgi:hypothetical protein